MAWNGDDVWVWVDTVSVVISVGTGPGNVGAYTLYVNVHLTVGCACEHCLLGHLYEELSTLYGTVAVSIVLVVPCPIPEVLFECYTWVVWPSGGLGDGFDSSLIAS